MTNVFLAGKLVARSKNLRGMRDYGRRSPVARVECRKRNAHPKDPAGVIRVEYANGATCTADFASYNIMVDFVRNRRSWRGADIHYLDGNTGYLTSPGILAP